MPETRELAQLIDRETGDVNNLRDKKLADATAQQQSGSASTDSVVMKTTGGEYVEIARDSFVGAIKGVMDGLIKGNSYTTLGANDPIAAFNSNALGGITPANLASVLGVDDPKYRALDIPIPFEDEGVKARVVERYGGITGGLTQVPGMRGEITYRQAMAAADISFNGVALGGPFNELRFFRNIKSFGSGNFYYCGSTSLIIPEGVTIVGSDVFRGNVCYIEFPSTVKSIGNRAFYQGSYVVKIYATTPPTLGSANNDKVTKLMVPHASLIAYQQADVWSQFASVMEGF